MTCRTMLQLSKPVPLRDSGECTILRVGGFEGAISYEVLLTKTL